MLDLDKYLNNHIEMKIGGEVVSVKQPTVAMIDAIDQIEEGLTDENAREKKMEIVKLMINNNKEEKRFRKEDLKEWTMEALDKVIITISLLRFEAENDPN